MIVNARGATRRIRAQTDNAFARHGSRCDASSRISATHEGQIPWLAMRKERLLLGSDQESSGFRNRPHQAQQISMSSSKESNKSCPLSCSTIETDLNR